jgi:hypothetical protein
MYRGNFFYVVELARRDCSKTIYVSLAAKRSNTDLSVSFCVFWLEF